MEYSRNCCSIGKFLSLFFTFSFFPITYFVVNYSSMSLMHDFYIYPLPPFLNHYLYFSFSPPHPLLPSFFYPLLSLPPSHSHCSIPKYPSRSLCHKKDNYILKQYFCSIVDNSFSQYNESTNHTKPSIYNTISRCYCEYT